MTASYEGIQQAITSMASTRDTLLTALAAFAGGLLTGILIAPDSGARTRERIADEARARMKRLEGRLDSIQEQLSGLDDVLGRKTADLTRRARQVGEQVSARVRSAAHEAGSVVPDDPDAFHVDSGEVAHDLRRMPKK